MRNNTQLLLTGCILIKEITSDQDKKNGLIRWAEISLYGGKEKRNYFFRVDNYAMLKGSSYFRELDAKNALFRTRISSFLKSDIDNEYDPSYGGVGNYTEVVGISNLEVLLQENGLEINQFVDSSSIDSYPL